MDLILHIEINANRGGEGIRNGPQDSLCFNDGACDW